MRRQLLDASSFCGVLHDMPDHLFRDPVSPDRAGTIHTSEQPPVRDGRGLGPFVQIRFDPIGNWDGTNVTTLANQIDHSSDDVVFNAGAGWPAAERG